jgi:hypothetical protein
MRVAELFEVFAWICDSCGTMNYVHPVIKVISEEQLNNEYNARSEDGGGAIVETHPSIVVCPLCKESFQTAHIQEEQDDNV